MKQLERFQRENRALRNKARVVDGILRAIAAAGRPFASTAKLPVLDSLEFQKILVLETFRIGDVVLMLPLLNALRARFPRAKIDVFGNEWAGEVLQHSSAVDSVISTNIPWVTGDYSIGNVRRLFRTARAARSRGYDLALEPRGDLRNNFLMWLIGATRRVGFDTTGGEYFLTDVFPSPPETHLIEARFSLLRALGELPLLDAPRLEPRADSLESARTFLASNGFTGSRVVALHPGASHAYKRAEPKTLGAVARQLRAAGVGVVLVGGPEDSEALDAVAAGAGAQLPRFQRSLAETIALFSLIDLLIAMDSGAAHLSAAVRCKTLVLFSHRDTGFSRPWSDQLRVLVPPEGATTIEAIPADQIATGALTFLERA